jgi:hypothetical protein
MIGRQTLELFIFWGRKACITCYSSLGLTNLLHTIGTYIFFTSVAVRHCDVM